MNHISQYFNYENISNDSINQYEYIFLPYKNNPPSLKEALIQMLNCSGLKNNESYALKLINQILNEIKKHLETNFEKIKLKYPKITYETAQIISSYTCELSKKDQNYNTYKILNSNLVSDNRENGIKNVSKYLFIFLKALRQLERFYPKKTEKYLYRCINKKVDLNYDSFNKDKIPYLRGNKKKFWSFSSASVSPQTCFNFLGKDVCNNNIKKGTIFTLTGNVWGYDITLFNVYNEKEILLEPEREFFIKESLPPVNGIIYVRCKILDTSIVLGNNILNSDIEENFNINNLINEKNKENNLKENINIFSSSNKNKNDIQHINYENININPNTPKKLVEFKSKKLFSSKSEQNFFKNNNKFNNNLDKISTNHNKLVSSINNLNKGNNNNLISNKNFNTIDNDNINSKKFSINQKNSLNKNFKNLKEDKISIENTYIYYLNEKLSEFSNRYEVYCGINKLSKEEVTVILQPVNCSYPLLDIEIPIYKDLKGGFGIPKLHWNGQQGENKILILDSFDHNLNYYFKLCNFKFSLLTTLMLVDQMLSIIEFIHKKEYIYINLKPDTFFFGKGNKQNNIYLTSFYMAKKYLYIDFIKKLHIPYKKGIQFMGNHSYASINQEKDIEPSRRDDIESLGYILVYFFKGKLPWSYMPINTKDDIEKIKDIKINTSVETLCEGCPKEFKDFINYARNLKFEEKPNYDKLRGLLDKIRVKNNLVFDYNNYDWKVNFDL